MLLNCSNEEQINYSEKSQDSMDANVETSPVFNFKKVDNLLNLYWTNGVDNLDITTFTYKPSYKDDLYYFPNGNIIGFLPKKNNQLKIKAHNDYKHDSILFFADINTKTIEIISIGKGWDFSLLNGTSPEQKWVIDSKKNDDVYDTKLISMSMSGEVNKSYSLTHSILGDPFIFREYNNDYAILSIKNIEKSVEYEIDYLNNTITQLSDIEENTSH